MYNFRAEKEYNNPVHRHIKETGITEDGGIIHIFEDGSHTYIEPYIVREILKDYLKLRDEELPYIDLGHEY